MVDRTRARTARPYTSARASTDRGRSRERSADRGAKRRWIERATKRTCDRVRIHRADRVERTDVDLPIGQLSRHPGVTTAVMREWGAGMFPALSLVDDTVAVMGQIEMRDQVRYGLDNLDHARCDRQHECERDHEPHVVLDYCAEEPKSSNGLNPHLFSLLTSQMWP